MSTYFYLACRTCRRFVPLASTHGGRASGLAGDEWLRAFAVAHGDEHELFSASEHDDSLANFIEVDAESSNNDERSRFYEQNQPAWYVDAEESERRIKAKKQELIMQYAKDHAQCGKKR